ncbi:hypothetical protein AVEN_60332-1, partial [Araneus ventricosus]
SYFSGFTHPLLFPALALCPDNTDPCSECHVGGLHSRCADVHRAGLPVSRRTTNRSTQNGWSSDSHVISVVRPRAELHEAALSVEGEVLDVDLAGALVDGRWVPHHPARAVDDGLGHDGHLVVAVRTATERKHAFISAFQSRKLYSRVSLQRSLPTANFSL